MAAQGSSTSTRSRSPFRSWTERPPHPFVAGVNIRAIGGEQVMAVVDGEVTITIEGETRTLRAGDVAVVNRGLEHELHSMTGVTFFEALAPVPLDHVPDRELDLVLGPDGGTGHV